MAAWLQGRRRSLPVAMGLSVFVHAVLYALLHRAAHAPPIFELKPPSEVELGLVDGDGEPAPAPAPPPPPPPRPKPKRKPVEKKPKLDGFGPVVDAGPPADDAPSDAGVADGGVMHDAGIVGASDGPHGDGHVVGALGDGFGIGDGGHGMGGFALPGAQIGLHVDLEVLRDSSLSLESKALLGIIPQWQKLLVGSGFDPLHSRWIKRVFVATPNLRRNRLIVAVGFEGDRGRVERAVTKMARGKPAPWTQQDGYSVAPWHNRGPTKRVLALVADDQFTIARAVDVPRVLAVARAMDLRRARERRYDARGRARLAEVFDNEAVAVTVENTEVIVPERHPGVPDRLRFSVYPWAEHHAHLVLRGRYADVAAAKAALKYLEVMQARLVEDQWVHAHGLWPTIRDAEMIRDRDVITIKFLVTMHDTRYLFQSATKVLEAAAE